MSNCLEKKIDFAVVFSVKNANPNGDPLNGNRPRETYDGLGEVSDVCIKRKLRNRLQDLGQRIFVQSDDRCDDGFKSLHERVLSNPDIVAAKNDKDRFAKAACASWFDVRAFGQVFAFKGNDVSVGVRGPVSVHSAESLSPVEIESLQITKSVNSEAVKDGKKASDTMGTKHRVSHATYVFYGSINCQLAEKTGFSNEDALLLKKALVSLFENDSSSARPDGSMEVNKVFWWEHNCKNGLYSSAKVHHSLKITAKTDDPKSIDDYEIESTPLEGLNEEVIEGK
ncbi:MAG: type I-C CRISPR-associated protein Cas7/Csd2 [Candidatus Cloacimonetes bacterium]|nr:type I-C CRISPR-associated protein Cas7/Csd2 [Candidatus Cloacimonadota bacterium]